MSIAVIRDFAYDAARATLDVTFVSGRRFRYVDVPPHVAERFDRTPCKGRFFNMRVRDRFAYRIIARG